MAPRPMQGMELEGRRRRRRRRMRMRKKREIHVESTEGYYELHPSARNPERTVLTVGLWDCDHENQPQRSVQG
eukprot:766962-Hanusia_phi.AAC.6